jgi:hypothetical protein
MVSAVSVSVVYALSHNQDNKKTSDGHGRFDRPFSEMDADGDDSLSREEWQAFKSAHGLKHMD